MRHHREFPDRHLIDEVAQLGLPYPEEIVITHGSALVTHGLRQEHLDGDIDAVTNLENMRYAEDELGFRAVRMVVGITDEGKERTIIARRDETGRYDLHRWDFSIHRYNETLCRDGKGQGRLYLPELGAMSDQDAETGIWVARPELVLLTKLDTARPEDEADITLIRRHVKSK